MKKQYFKPDLIVLILTLIQLVLIIFFASKSFVSNSIFHTVLDISICLFFIYFASRIPIFTHISNSNIIVVRLVGKKKFNINDYIIQKITNAELKGSIRIAGSGGMSGYLGLFKNKKIGSYRMIALNTKEIYLLKSKNDSKKYVINLKTNWEEYT